MKIRETFPAPKGAGLRSPTVEKAIDLSSKATKHRSGLIEGELQMEFEVAFEFCLVDDGTNHDISTEESHKNATR